jgi:hypothetical protein
VGFVTGFPEGGFFKPENRVRIRAELSCVILSVLGAFQLKLWAAATVAQVAVGQVGG